jgi:hypothetical protein
MRPDRRIPIDNRFSHYPRVAEPPPEPYDDEPTWKGVLIARSFILADDGLAGIGRVYLKEHGIPDDATPAPMLAAAETVPASDPEAGWF